MKSVKRIFATVVCAIFLSSGLFVFASEGQGGPPDIIVDTESGESAAELLSQQKPAWMAASTAPTDASALNIGGKSAVLMDLSSGKILFEKNSHEKLPIASVTKVMTLLLIMEAIDSGKLKYTDNITCSEVAMSMGGSQIWLEVGETMTVDELLKAIAVVSANDACAMMAEHLSGSIESFVAEMNARAAELGMKDTKFLDCSGLSDEAYSSAHDVALMSRELMKHNGITKYTTIWMDSLRGGKSQLVNTNKLVRHYQGATGLKTGTTSKAGHNLSATAKRDNMSLCAVILGCATTDERFGGARKMLDYGFANYSLYTPKIDPTALKPLRVLHGVKETVPLVADDVLPMLIKKGQDKSAATVMEISENVEAPVSKGQIIGKITLTFDGKEVASYSVRAAEDVKKMKLGNALAKLLTALVG